MRKPGALRKVWGDLSRNTVWLDVHSFETRVVLRMFPENRDRRVVWCSGNQRRVNHRQFLV